VQTNRKQAAFLLFVMAALAGTTAHAQTDVSVSALGEFNNSTSGNGTVQSSPNSGGGMVGVRHVFNPLVGLEFNFAVEGSKQSLAPEAGSCGFRCNNPPITVNGTGIEFTANYVVSGRFRNLRPFAEAGLGFRFTNPTGSIIGLNSLSRPVWVGAGGADWNFTSRLGVRLQYRVDFYKAPDVYLGYSPTGAFAVTQEPMIGVFYRF
jgi:opacity protein-like surface antigen